MSKWMRAIEEFCRIQGEMTAELLSQPITCRFGSHRYRNDHAQQRLLIRAVAL